MIIKPSGLITINLISLALTGILIITSIASDNLWLAFFNVLTFAVLSGVLYSSIQQCGITMYVAHAIRVLGRSRGVIIVRLKQGNGYICADLSYSDTQHLPDIFRNLADQIERRG